MAGVSAGDIQQVAKVLERYRGGVRRDDAKGGGGKSGGPDVEQEDKAWSSGRIRWPPVSAGSPEFRLFSKAPPFRRFAVSGLAALNHAFFNVTGILLIAVNLVIAAWGVIGDDWSASSSPARSRFGGLAGGWTIGIVGALWSYLVVYCRRDADDTSAAPRGAANRFAACNIACMHVDSPSAADRDDVPGGDGSPIGKLHPSAVFFAGMASPR